MNSIPSFLDTKNLYIRSGKEKQDKTGTTRTVQAEDPQGDRVTVCQWTEPTGPATMMPQQTLSVTYQEKGQKPVEHAQIGSDEAYDLYSALRTAERGQHVDKDVDIMTLGWLMGDLASKGGAGGAC